MAYNPHAERFSRDEFDRLVKGFYGTKTLVCDRPFAEAILCNNTGNRRVNLGKLDVLASPSDSLLHGPKNVPGHWSRCGEWTRFFFANERGINGLSAEARQEARQEQSAPLVTDLLEWLRETRPKLSLHNEGARRSTTYSSAGLAAKH